MCYEDFDVTARASFKISLLLFTYLRNKNYCTTSNVLQRQTDAKASRNALDTLQTRITDSTFWTCCNTGIIHDTCFTAYMQPLEEEM